MRRARQICAVVAVSTMLTGCFTGERAHFAPATTLAAPISDPAIDLLLAKLQTTYPAPFNASYTILQKLGVVSSAATVAQSSPTTTSVTVGDVRFLDSDGVQQTCQLSTGTCIGGFDDSQISDRVPSHDFYRASAAARLRQDAATMSAPAVASARTVAGQPASCVVTTFAEGTKEYCVLDSGVLAYQDTPDLKVELTAFSNEPPLDLFSPTTIAGG